MSTRFLSRIAILSTAAILSVSLAACGGDDATDAEAADERPQTQEPAKDTESRGITGGRTLLRLDEDLIQAISTVGGDVEAVGEATMSGNHVTLPITGGSMDFSALSGEIEHAGGLRFEVAGQSVEVRDLVLEPDRDVVTAEIAGERVPFLGTDFKQPDTIPVRGTVVLPATATTVTSSALSDRIGIDVLGDGVTLGSLVSYVKRG